METVASLLPILASHGCPCRFPRFVFLVGFNFQDYKVNPVACVDTEELVVASYHGQHAFLRRESQRQVQDSTHTCYVCEVCGALWEGVFTDYSISMFRSYLRLESSVLAPLGPAPTFPFPVSKGFRAFNKADYEVCAKQFYIASVDKCIEYLAECN